MYNVINEWRRICFIEKVYGSKHIKFKPLFYFIDFLHKLIDEQQHHDGFSHH